jgi:hypothetical protein
MVLRTAQTDKIGLQGVNPERMRMDSQHGGRLGRWWVFGGFRWVSRGFWWVSVGIWQVPRWVGGTGLDAVMLRESKELGAEGLGFVWHPAIAQVQQAGQRQLNDVVEAGFVVVEEEEVWTVAGQRVEGSDDALQVVGRTLGGDLEVEGLALYGPEAADAPGGGTHILDGGLLDGVARGDALDVLAKQVFKAGAGLALEDGGAGQQAVADGVTGGPAFAGGGFGAARARAVGAGSGLLSRGSHKAPTTV